MQVFGCAHVPCSMQGDRNSETMIPAEICGPFGTVFPGQLQSKEMRSKQINTLDRSLSFVKLDLQFKLAWTNKQKKGFIGSNSLEV